MSRTELTMVLTSALLHAVWSASVKGSRSPLAFNSVQSGLVFLAAPVVLPLFEWSEIPRSVLWLLAATSVVHGVYSYFMCRAYERADLSLVYPIIRSTPAVLPLVAVPVLGESLTPGGVLGISVVVGGVWLVHAGQGIGARQLLAPGLGFAYLTLLATVGYSLIDKQAMAQLSNAPWSGPAPRSVVYFFLLFWGHAFVLVPLAVRRTGIAELSAVARSEGGRAGVALLASLFSYGLILEAYRTAPASYVVAVRQTSVLFAVVLAAGWLGERPDRRRLLGAVATVVGVGLIALLT